MSSAKIVVVSLKEIIRTTLFAITGIALIILLIYLFMPKNNMEPETKARYIPGEYKAEIILHNSKASVVVNVDENEILSVRLADELESQPVFYPLINSTFDSISQQIVENQSTTVTTTVNNAYTSKVVIEAVDTALEHAKVH